MNLVSYLLPFLLVIPVLSHLQSVNDPFRAIASTNPGQPICCLKPLTPTESVDDELLLSFNEWKAKQSSEQLRSPNHTSNLDVNGSGHSLIDSNRSRTEAPAQLQQGLNQDTPNSQEPELLSPHFRVPLTDRFNYASLECSARVHLAHKAAKSPAAILSAQRDRYMLSPCTSKEFGEDQFVVVELCADIHIDTVQLANFEFFSGVFKDFTVSVAKTYTLEKEGWTAAGTYRAKNIRGIQSFHPPTSLRDFYRYIRIDFHSHYGSEYYCPVSLLRVYGLTHLEEWKWDVWEAEGGARRDGIGMEESAATSGEVSTSRRPLSTVEDIPRNEGISNNGTETTPSQEPTLHGSSTENLANATSLSTPYFVENLSSTDIPTPGNKHPTTTEIESSSHHTDPPYHSGDITEDNNDNITVLATDSQPQMSATQSNITPASSSSSATISAELSSRANSLEILEFSNISLPLRPSSSSSSSSFPPLPSIPVPSPTGGESIYRTIMNRLTALQANQTLYSRYVEEQGARTHVVLRRLSEDIGRLDGIGKAQAQAYQRTIQEWENRRRKLEIEYKELVSRVNYLADEITFEKRLGIAQLCLLLTVLVFMALTRGSHREALFGLGQHSPLDLRPLFRTSLGVKEWGRRTLSFSRFRSTSPPIVNEIKQEDGRDVKLEFPRQANSHRRALSSEFKLGKHAHAHAHAVSRSRSRTPSLRPSMFAGLARSVTPPGYRVHPAVSALIPEPLRRSNSHGTVADDSPASSPRSAKKWARSAHLHEVRVGSGKGSKLRKVEMDEADVFFGPSDTSVLRGKDNGKGTLRGRREPTFDVKPPPPSPSPGRPSDGDSGDVWVDTDADGSADE